MDAILAMEQEIKEYEQAKEAGFWNAFRSGITGTGIGDRAANALVAGGVAAGVGAAGAAGAGLVGGIKAKVDKHFGFKKMMRMNPGLEKQDATKVRNTFNSLASLNPDYAQDPLVAGSFVARSLDAGVGQGLGLGGGYIDVQTTRTVAKNKMPGAVLQQFMAHARPEGSDDWQGKATFQHGLARSLEDHRGALRTGEATTRFGRDRSLARTRYRREREMEGVRQGGQAARDMKERAFQKAQARLQRVSQRDLARRQRQSQEGTARQKLISDAAIQGTRGEQARELELFKKDLGSKQYERQ